ncbi:DUF2849 domain-containing protein [Pedomonas mirosovicensis]|uniref:DUF2849 domain-containing protein n=1 Tax=Pedomonas mirosovicensis TaxID=2908641 RepID=UPI00216826FA|nr:DUF2849 domain-containing protein [Pedomonas mirosovicensis]MCH8684258.1 DUF2849 domain-containing protein [Pedomonas mirosovicensis]
MPQVMTAYDVPTGDVVYWAGNGWTRDVREAAVFDDPATAEAVAVRDAAAQIVMDYYPIDVELKDGKPWPTRYREVVRASGPSVRLDLGKQAEL